MSKKLSDNFSGLNAAIQEYLRLRIDILKLSLLDKTAKTSLVIISHIVFIVLAALLFLFAAAAFVVWYGQSFNDYLAGLLIIAGLIAVLGLFFIIFRKRLIANNIVRQVSSILFEEEEEDE